MADLGSDFAGVDDLDANLTIVSGRLCLAQNLARRLLQPPGSELHKPHYGLGLAQYIGDVFDRNNIAREAEDQLMQDERVNDATVEATLVDGTISLNCEVDDGDGPFEFVVASDGLTSSMFLKEAS